MMQAKSCLAIIGQVVVMFVARLTAAPVVQEYIHCVLIVSRSIKNTFGDASRSLGGLMPGAASLGRIHLVINTILQCCRTACRCLGYGVVAVINARGYYARKHRHPQAAQIIIWMCS